MTVLPKKRKGGLVRASQRALLAHPRSHCRGAFPDFSETFRWGAGVGLRYFTGFGPIRLDVAVPVNKRDTDDEFQFYISFGQAF